MHERLTEEEIRLHRLHVATERFLLCGCQALELVGRGEDSLARADAAERRAEAELNAESARLEWADEIAVDRAWLGRVEVVYLTAEDARRLRVRAGKAADGDEHPLRGRRDSRGSGVIRELIDARVVGVDDLVRFAGRRDREQDGAGSARRRVVRIFPSFRLPPSSFLDLTRISNMDVMIRNQD